MARLFFILFLLVSTVTADQSNQHDPTNDGYNVVMQHFAQVFRLAEPYSSANNITAVHAAAKALIPAYDRIQARSGDPMKRALVNVNVTDVTAITFHNGGDGNRRSLRSSRGLADSTFDTYIRVKLSVSGVCFACPRDVNLANQAAGRRRLRRLEGDGSSALDGLAPSTVDLVAEQNKEIAESGNALVIEASDLLAEVVSLAIEAQVAETKARVKKEHLETLELYFESKQTEYDQVLDMMGQLEDAINQKKGFLEGLTNNGANESAITAIGAEISAMEIELEEFHTLISNYEHLLTTTLQKLVEAETNLAEAERKAKDFEREASAAEKKAIRADKEDLQHSKVAAKLKNAALVENISVLLH